MKSIILERAGERKNKQPGPLSCCKQWPSGLHILEPLYTLASDSQRTSERWGFTAAFLYEGVGWHWVQLLSRERLLPGHLITPVVYFIAVKWPNHAASPNRFNKDVLVPSAKQISSLPNLVSSLLPLIWNALLWASVIVTWAPVVKDPAKNSSQRLGTGRKDGAEAKEESAQSGQGVSVHKKEDHTLHNL